MDVVASLPARLPAVHAGAPVSFLADDIKSVRQADQRQRRNRRSSRVAPREYARLTAIWRPLLEAALDQPNPTPALRAAATRIKAELEL